jgi:hypothetical protein
MHEPRLYTGGIPQIWCNPFNGFADSSPDEAAFAWQQQQPVNDGKVERTRKQKLWAVLPML